MSDPKPRAAEMVEVFLRMGKAGHYTTALLEDIVFAARAEAVAPVLEVLRDLVAMSARCKFAGCTTIALWRDPFDGLVCDTHRSAFDSGFENMPAVEALPRADALRAALALLAEHKEGT